MGYEKFLGRTETRTYPHFGGTIVDAPDRTLRLAAPLDPGWWRLEIKGRKATVLEPADPDAELLATLPSLRGHLLFDRLFRSGAQAEPLFFLPPDQPARFSLIRARRWSGGPAIFESVDFDTEAEEAARRALEDQRSLAGERGIPATLRAAFGFAVASEVARRLGIPVSPAELATRLVDIAGENGRALAEVELARIAREREIYQRHLAERRQLDAARDRAQEIMAMRRGTEDAELRAEQALIAAGAQFLDARRLDGGLLEVTYRFMGERFLTIVEQAGLRVVDAGICLAGYDDRVTLESLPGVIREAIEDGHLVIARRDAADPIHRYHWERANVPEPD
jgi:hypothetical protein